MTAENALSNWNKPAKVGMIISAVTGISKGLMITTYAIFLGIKSRGAPDGDLIDLFANQSQWAVLVLNVLLTFFYSIHLAQQAKGEGSKTGLLLGLFVGGISLILSTAFGGWDLVNLVSAITIIFAGLVGGLVGYHK